MTLQQRFAESCSRQPEKLALIDPTGALTYGELRARVAGFAQVIASHVAEPNVGLLLPTVAGFPIAFFASLSAGKVPVPLNFLLAPEELAAVCQDAGIRTIVTSRVFAGALGTSGVKLIVMEEPPAPTGATLAAPADADLATLLYTSGTIGQPKGVELTHRSLGACVDACIQYAQLDADQVFLAVLPLFHAFGLTGSMLLPLLLGATTVCVPKFTPNAVLETVAARRVSVMIAVASMFGALIRVQEASPVDTSSLWLCVSGGEPLPEAVAEGFAAAFGHSLLEGFGMTETSPIVSINVPGHHRPGSVGRMIPGVEARIVDEVGGVRAANQHGEIQLRGDVVMRGYYRRPEETAEVLDGDGWLSTGDMGYLDEDAYLWIDGRKKEMIISAGQNIYPREIEAALLTHPDVEEVAVIGVADAGRGEVPKAFVVLCKGAEADVGALRRWCGDCLSGFKRPRHFEIRDELPHAPSGKVLKKQLPRDV